MTDSKPDTVPGLGFKDKEKALETIQILEGRDPDYQKLAIKGLIGRAKRTLTLTKDKDKLQNINSAMGVFEEWLKDFEKNNLSKENRAYLPLATIKALKSLKDKYKIKCEKAEQFIKAYESSKGEYKNLRTVSSEENQPTWDIVRNSELKAILKRIDDTSAELWDKDLPSKEHTELILWGYSPEAAKIKKSLSSLESKLESKVEDLAITEKKTDKQSKKRKSQGKAEESSTSTSSDDETPKKRSK